MIYAGIGSRKTPKEILDIFELLGERLASINYTLRSGGAEGADKAFERGCDKSNGKKEIWLPWRGFEGSKSTLVVENPFAFTIASEHHPNWTKLSQGAQKLQARNTHQILGTDLNTPVDFVVCWTENGSGSGGTGQAIRLANHYSIPVFDFGDYFNIEAARSDFNAFHKRIRDSYATHGLLNT